MALSSGDADRELIVDIASNAILRSDEDPAVVIRAAKNGSEEDWELSRICAPTRLVRSMRHWNARP